MPIGQEDETALDRFRQDEGFFPQIAYRLVPLQLDGGESRGVQGCTQGKRLGGNEVFAFLFTDFDAGRKDTDGLLAEEGGEAGDGLGLHPQDGAVCPGPAGDEAAGIRQVRFHVAGERTDGGLLRPLLFRFFRGKGNVAIVRLAEGGEEEAFAPRFVGKETIDRKGIPEAAGYLPRRVGLDGERLGPELLYYIMYSVLVLLGVVGTGAIDQQTAGLQRAPDVREDLPLPLGAEADIRGRPLGAARRVFAEHAFAGAGDVGQDEVEKMGEAAQFARLGIRYDALRIAPFGNIFGKDIRPAADDFVAHHDTPFRQKRAEMRRFSTRCRAEVEADEGRIAGVLPDGLLEEHRRGLLHVVSSGVEERIEGERGASWQVTT